MATAEGFADDPEPIHRGPVHVITDWRWEILAERIQHLRELILRELAALDVAKKLQAAVYEQRLEVLNSAHAAAETARREQVPRFEFDGSVAAQNKELRDLNDRLLRMEAQGEAERANRVKLIAMLTVVMTVISTIITTLISMLVKAL